MVHVVQLLLPLYENDQQPAPAEDLHAIVKAELTRHFGRCAAHTLSCATNHAMAGRRDTPHDLVIFEVMSHLFDSEWWGWYQQVLDTRFRQVKVIIRELPLICW